jgi:acyl carrier protein
MKNKISQILKEIRPEFNFDEDSNFIENGMLDSFDVVSLVTALDEEFKISIEGTDIIPENFSTLETIFNLLDKYGCKL